MAEKKKISLGGIDNAAEGKGSFMKTLWQLIKFMVVSGLVTIIQLVLANVLPLIFDMEVFKVGLPDFLAAIFKPNTIFDASVFTTPIGEWIDAATEAIRKCVTVFNYDGLNAVRDNWDSVKGIIGVEEFKIFKTQLTTYSDISKYVLGFDIQNGSIVAGTVTWGYLLPFFLSNLIANIYGYIQNMKTTFKTNAPKYMFAIYIVLMIALILFSTWLQGVLYGWLGSFNSEVIRGAARTIGGLAAGFVQMVVLFPMEKFVLFKEKKGEIEAEAEEVVEEAAE